MRGHAKTLKTTLAAVTMAASDSAGDDSLYPIAVLIDELKNDDVQVSAEQMCAMVGGDNPRASMGCRPPALGLNLGTHGV